MSDPVLDLDRWLRLPRLADLDVSPDGRSLVFSVGRLGREKTRFARDLWRLATDGKSAPERLTVGESTDHAARWLGDGSIVFLSNRPDPAPADVPGEEEGAKKDDEPRSQVWLLPTSGEPRSLTRRPGDVIALGVARGGRAVACRASVHPRAADLAADWKAERARKKEGASGLLFDGLPIRFWDRFYGPRYEHLFAARAPEGLLAAADLTPQATVEVDDLGFDVSADGRFLCAAERERDDEGRFAENLRVFDLTNGTSKRITQGRDAYAFPRFSPDGRSVVAVLHEQEPGRIGRQWLVSVPVKGGAERRLTADLDLWPEAPVWAPDGRSAYFVADVRGDHAAFRVGVEDGRVVRLTGAGGVSDLVPSPDGRTLYALASRLDRPWEVVAIDPTRESQEPRPLARQSEPELEGVRLPAARSTTCRAADGREIHSLLVVPQGPRPKAGWPLLVWIHGGPLGSWADQWHWRWNPQLFAARGWATLLVNPRLSTGYGQAFIEEGRARWGGEPYEDILAAVDAAMKLPEIDPSRTGAMGGSFGGYMANWIAGHTDRFTCIVSHAGLWHLVGFHGTTDYGPEWEREFGGDPYRHPEVYERWSPHHEVRKIRTPILLVHGEKDFRVPVAEAFQMFTALQRLGVPSQLLYFPDENHWILKPPNVRTWHETIWAWLERWLGSAPA